MTILSITGVLLAAGIAISVPAWVVKIYVGVLVLGIVLAILFFSRRQKMPFPWLLAPSLVVGAVISAPLAAYLVSRIPVKRLTLIIGSVSTLLGGYTLARVLFY